MSLFSQNPDFFNQPVLLPERFRETPLEYITHFFEDHKLSELWEFNSKVLETVLTGEESIFEYCKNRDEAILMFRHSQMLLEAAFLVSRQKE